MPNGDQPECCPEDRPGNDYAKLMMEKVGLEQTVAELERLLFAMLDGYAWRAHDPDCKCTACEAGAYLKRGKP